MKNIIETYLCPKTYLKFYFFTENNQKNILVNDVVDRNRKIDQKALSSIL